MKIIGLKILGHDTGAALLIDNQVVAISQERLDRKKYSRAFPEESVNYCLSAANLNGIETETFYRGNNNSLHQITRNYAPVNQFTGWLLNFSGVGNFYSQVTYFLGFGKHEEGKTMGLAPYGQGKFISEIPEKHFIKKVGDSRYVFPTHFEPHPSLGLKYVFKKSSISRKSSLIKHLKLLAHSFSK